MVNTANLFAANGHPVTLVILDDTAQSFYTIDPKISLLQLPLSFGISSEGNIITRKLRMLSDVLRLRKILRSLKPDILISSEYPFTVAMVLAGAGKQCRIYSWEHHHFHWLKKNRFWTKACEWAYPRLHGVICLNASEKKYYPEKPAVSIIPNHLNAIKTVLADPANRQLLTIGSLIARKGIDFLLAIAPKILQQHPGWKWKIIGDGVLKEAVEDCIRREGLEGRLLLQEPAGEDLQKEYAASSLYVMTSRFEAFPMVLLEAMQQGLPCISFDCESGPASIITNGEDGLLVAKEDSNAMCQAIDSMIRDEKRRAEMGAAASRNIRRFEGEKVYVLWKEIFEKKMDSR